jgi:pyruvate,water dikinase
MVTRPGEVISLPADFPVTWDPPEDEQRYWFWDQMHHPHAVTPMTSSLDGPAFAEGFGKACSALYMPMRTMEPKTFNCYLYYGGVAHDEGPDEAADRANRLQAEMMQRVPRCLRDWETVYLPEVMDLNGRLRDFPYSRATPRQLADIVDEALAIRTRAWELHFLAVMPAMGAATEFARVYEEALGQPAEQEHYRMLQGFPNKSVEAGQALYDIAQEFKSSEAAEIILSAPSAEVFDRLESSSGGNGTARRLRSYLDEYGWRSDQFELADPSWREDPRPMFYNLKSYLRDDATDPAAEQQKAAAERERLVVQMLGRVNGDAARRNTLQMMVTLAQQYLPVQENHNFYIDQMNTVLLRRPVLEVGRRLAQEGVLERASDAFMLTHTEARDAALEPDPALTERVTRRKAEMERWSKVVPPMFIGTQPLVQERPDTIDRFWGLDKEPSKDPKVVTGYAASKGTVRGTAKVVRRLDEADKLEHGDILVCEMTMPAWTPLFSTVAAVVADTGGALSHCAIVAREYGIPCVAGTRIGTRRIKDGQTLTVDGTKGVVRIEDR